MVEVIALCIQGWIYQAVAKPARSHGLGPEKPSLLPAAAQVAAHLLAGVVAPVAAVEVEGPVAPVAAAVPVLASMAPVASRQARSAGDVMVALVGHAYDA